MQPMSQPSPSRELQQASPLSLSANRQPQPPRQPQPQPQPQPQLQNPLDVPFRSLSFSVVPHSLAHRSPSPTAASPASPLSRTTAPARAATPTAMPTPTPPPLLSEASRSPRPPPPLLSEVSALASSSSSSPQPPPTCTDFSHLELAIPPSPSRSPALSPSPLPVHVTLPVCAHPHSARAPLSPTLSHDDVLPVPVSSDSDAAIASQPSHSPRALSSSGLVPPRVPSDLVAPRAHSNSSPEPVPVVYRSDVPPQLSPLLQLVCDPMPNPLAGDFLPPADSSDPLVREAIALFSRPCKTMVRLAPAYAAHCPPHARAGVYQIDTAGDREGRARGGEAKGKGKGRLHATATATETAQSEAEAEAESDAQEAEAGAGAGAGGRSALNSDVFSSPGQSLGLSVPVSNLVLRAGWEWRVCVLRALDVVTRA